MSNSVTPSGSDSTDRTGLPRALVHKKILDEAESQPDASIEEIARAVSGASIRLVEDVLEEYGDPSADEEPASDSVDEVAESSTETDPLEPPAEAQSVADASEAITDSDSRSGIESEAEADQGDETDATTIPDPTQLTRKQLQTLRAIEENTNATQGELATELGVSRAAICQRVNAITGFEWSNRDEFVTELFDTEEADRTKVETDETDRVVELERRLQRIETRLDESSAVQVAIDDPELAHRVVHACLSSDRISEDEELRLIREFFGATEGVTRE